MCPTYLNAYKAQSYKDTANIEKKQLLSKQIRQKNIIGGITWQIYGQGYPHYLQEEGERRQFEHVSETYGIEVQYHRYWRLKA